MIKKVVEGFDENSVLRSDIKEGNIYAAWTGAEGHSLVIVHDVDQMGISGFKTQWLYTDEMINNNYSNESIQGLVRDMMKDGWDIYEFETEEEFAEWILSVYNNED